MPTPENNTNPPQGLEWWHGLLGLMVGGFLAHIGGFVAVVMILVVTLLVQGGPPAPTALSFPMLAAAIFATEGVLLTSAVLVPVVARRSLRRALGWRLPPWYVVLLAAIGCAGAGAFGDLFMKLAQWLAPGLTLGTNTSILLASGSVPIWAAVAVVAVAPGVAEELFFRGMFFRSLPRRWWGIPVTAVLFAGYHLDPHQVAAVLPLGFYLTWLAYRTDSIVPPIAGHITNNLIAVVIAQLMGTDHSAVGPAAVAGVVPQAAVGLGVALLAAVAISRLAPPASAALE